MARALAVRPLVYLGKTSYSFYLLHALAGAGLAVGNVDTLAALAPNVAGRRSGRGCESGESQSRDCKKKSHLSLEVDRAAPVRIARPRRRGEGAPDVA